LQCKTGIAALKEKKPNRMTNKLLEKKIVSSVLQ
jgi:hypothetical protein